MSEAPGNGQVDVPAGETPPADDGGGTWLTHRQVMVVLPGLLMAMLLAMPNDQAAKILVSCPPDLCRDLLKGSRRPGRARRARCWY